MKCRNKVPRTDDNDLKARLDYNGLYDSIMVPEMYTQVWICFRDLN